MKIKVQRYDYEQTTNPSIEPYKFIDIGEFLCDDRLKSTTSGNELYRALVRKCSEMKTTFRYYSHSQDSNYDYVAVVVPDNMREQEDKFMERVYLQQNEPNLSFQELDAIINKPKCWEV